MGKEKNKKEEEMKFGFDQISKEPPQWLKIISNYSIMILGALAIWSLSIPDKYATAETKNFLGSTITLIVTILKGFELLSGKPDKTNTNDNQPTNTN